MNPEIPTASTSEIKYLNIAVSENGISESAGARRVVFIYRDKVDSIEIGCGLQADRPLLQSVTGLILILIGVGGGVVIADAGVALARWGLGFAAFGALGAWLLWEALRRGHYLRVMSAGNSRKLAIRGRVEKKALREFIGSASKLGYHFRDSLNDKTYG